MHIKNLVKTRRRFYPQSRGSAVNGRFSATCAFIALAAVLHAGQQLSSAPQEHPSRLRQWHTGGHAGQGAEGRACEWWGTARAFP